MKKPISRHLKHTWNCEAPLTDDDDRSDEQSDMPEPDAADDDLEHEQNKQYSVTDRYQSYTK